MRGIASLIALSVVLPACCGCKDWGTPRITPPFGSIGQQQARAQYHEPYPENDVGPPVEGGRPREYEPRGEVARELQPLPVVLAPRPPSQVPQAPADQPPIITPPPMIYYPPGVTPP